MKMALPKTWDTFKVLVLDNWFKYPEDPIESFFNRILILAFTPFWLPFVLGCIVVDLFDKIVK